MTLHFAPLAVIVLVVAHSEADYADLDLALLHLFVGYSSLLEVWIPPTPIILSNH